MLTRLDGDVYGDLGKVHVEGEEVEKECERHEPFTRCAQYVSSIMLCVCVCVCVCVVCVCVCGGGGKRNT